MNKGLHKMKDSKLLKPKEFDAQKHEKIIGQLHPHRETRDVVDYVE
jgi:hypothetical protein